MKPSTIKDLRVSNLDTTNKLLTVKFTAPGDNADLGTGKFLNYLNVMHELVLYLFYFVAFLYNIKAAYDPQVLHDLYLFAEEESQDDPGLNLNRNLIPLDIKSSSFVNLAPNQVGYEEHITFNINNLKEDSISLKIRAADANKNHGEWSPILTIKLNKVVKLSKSLKHFSKIQESQFLKTEEPVEEKSLYWQLFIFLVGTYFFIY